MINKSPIPAGVKDVAIELGVDRSLAASKYRQFAENAELTGTVPTVYGFKQWMIDNRPSMKAYWKAAHRYFRQSRGLTFGPANTAVNLAAKEGTTWFMAMATFKALNIAFSHIEPWTGPRQ